MGAGSVTSNIKSDKMPVVVYNGEEHIETGIKKFGAMPGDYVEQATIRFSILER